MCDSLKKIVSNKNVQSYSDLKCLEQNTLCQLYRFYDGGQFTDFELISCDGMHFKVHSLVLAAASEYLQNVVSKDATSHTFQCIDSETLEEVIRFCYLGEIRLSVDNIEAIIEAAHELQIHPLKKSCSEFLETSSDIENCLRYALLAERCDLKASIELAHNFYIINCTKMCKLKNIHKSQIDDFLRNFSNSNTLFDELMQKIKSSERNSAMTGVFSKDLFQAISKTFFLAGYIESLVITAAENAIQQNSNFSSPNKLPITVKDINDPGLFVIAKSRNGYGVEFYRLSDTDYTRIYLPKYRINTDGMKTITMRIFPHKNRIYICYSTRSQQLQIKSWCFKSQAMSDVLVPTTVQYLKPRLVSAVGDEILVSEEKYVSWPFEGFKTTVCKFGLESESYKSIEFSYDNLKEIICMDNEVFVFSSLKPEVVSFDLNTCKQTSRGTLNNNGTVKAVIFHGNLYVGCYIRSQCYLFIEKYDKKCNQWSIVGSICTYSDASHFHIGNTDNFLYVFYGTGKVQRYSDLTNHWTTLDFSDNFDQIVLCVSTSPFT